MPYTARESFYPEEGQVTSLPVERSLLPQLRALDNNKGANELTIAEKGRAERAAHRQAHLDAIEKRIAMLEAKRAKYAKEHADRLAERRAMIADLDQRIDALEAKVRTLRSVPVRHPVSKAPKNK